MGFCSKYMYKYIIVRVFFCGYIGNHPASLSIFLVSATSPLRDESKLMKFHSYSKRPEYVHERVLFYPQYEKIQGRLLNLLRLEVQIVGSFGMTHSSSSHILTC